MSEITENIGRVVKQEKIGNRTLLAYMLGGIGENTIFVMIVTFLIIYYTDDVGIPAAAVGTLFLITRIWDTASDLLWGVLIDNTQSRYGKFRPYILIGGIACSIALVATFSVPKMSMGATIAYAYLTYFILSTSFTSFDVSYWALSAALTRDPQVRNRFVLVTRTGAMGGQWVASLVTLPLLTFFAHSWSAVAMVYAAFFMICALITFRGVREPQLRPHREPHSPRVYLQLLRHHRPLVALMSYWIVFNFVISARVGFGLYYFKYVFHSEAAMGTFLGASTFVTLVGASVATLISSRTGKRRLCMTASVLLGISCIALFFTSGLPVSYAVLVNCIPNLFLGVIGVVLGAMLPDTVAWYELKHHRRAEGMIFSLNLFQLKLSGAIGGALTGFALAYLHYVPNVEQSAATLNGINLSFTLIPGALFLVASLLLLRYELTEARNREIAGQLMQRDGSA